MIVTVAIVLVAISLYLANSIYAGLERNIAAAKRSGLPYVVTPISLYNPFWLVTHRLWLPLIRKLPKSWTESWIDYMVPDWTFNLLYEPFKKHGETFLTVSPDKTLAWITTAEAINQITQRREAFPKPLESYAVLEIYGQNIVSTEGLNWRAHRKVLSPGFNEKNNALVFTEAVAQTQGMLGKWTAGGNATLKDVPTDTMRLTLHIISRVGFGVRLLWPEEEPRKGDKLSGINFGGNDPPKGHSMSFEHALSTLLDNLIWVLLVPSWLLKRIPIKSAKEAYESFINWGQYMNELFAEKVIEAGAGEQTEGIDIMGTLVKSAYGEVRPNGAKKGSPGRAEKGQIRKTVLSDSEILGDAFVMIIAGHETTANSIHFSLMDLAINPRSQRLLQKEVELIFGDASPETWDFESNINTLLGGMVGAVLNEELRLMPPVINIPKSVRKDQDQSIIIDGKKITLPRGCHITLNVVGIQRSPKYWPSRGPSKIDGRSDDLNDFLPERWLVKDTVGGLSKGIDTPEDSEEDDFGGFTGKDTAAQLFRPVRGAYLPFSDGARSCLGRRLAQVKIMAVLSVIFQKYSIELAVDEWANDEEVGKMSDQDKRDIYKKAQEKARKTMRGASTLITLKLHDNPGYIPVRIVKKGEERFLNLMD